MKDHEWTQLQNYIIASGLSYDDVMSMLAKPKAKSDWGPMTFSSIQGMSEEQFIEGVRDQMDLFLKKDFSEV